MKCAKGTPLRRRRWPRSGSGGRDAICINWFDAEKICAEQDAELEAWMKETEGLSEEEFVERYVR